MNVIFQNTQWQASVFVYFISVILLLGFIGMIFVYAPYKSSGGHIIKWYKDIPLKFKFLALGAFALMTAVIVLFIVLCICPCLKWVFTMNGGGGETVILEVNDENISFVDAEFRAEKIGYNIVFIRNNEEVRPITLFSDEDVSRIKASGSVEIRYGYIKSANEVVSEVWTIASRDAAD